jgi:membrane fusion protein, copper/silver efflux system
VNMVQPFFSEGEQFLAIRVYLSQGDWRIGQLVRARLKTETAEALWLPSKAVYDLGTTQVVFVKERGVYKPRTVATGLHANGWIEILSGLASTEEVAGQAAYLVDSESFIKTRSIK